MKSLYKKIGIVVLSGALLMGGVFVSGKSFAYAYDISIINELSYYLKFDVIDPNYDEAKKKDDVLEFGFFYGVSSEKEIGFFSDFNEFIYKLENKKLPKGMYIVIFEGVKVLVGIR